MLSFEVVKTIVALKILKTLNWLQKKTEQFKRN